MRWVERAMDLAWAAREAVAGWWERAVVERAAATADGVAAWWQETVVDRLAATADAMAAWWEGAASGRAAGFREWAGEVADGTSRVSRRMAVALVLAGALAGSGAAAATDGSARGESRPAAAAEPPARARQAHQPAFARKLPAVVDALAGARRQRLRRLAVSRTTRGQAVAAGSLGRAYRASAAMLGSVAGSRDREATALLRALRRTAGAYRALASAARAGDASGFAATRRQVQAAETGVRRALRRF